MKLLLTADLHGNHSWYEWLIEHCNSYDAVCIAGDLIDGLTDDGKEQCDYVTEQIQKIEDKGVPVFMCSGNHELMCQTYFSILDAKLGVFPLEKLVIATIPWGQMKQQEMDNLNAAKKIATACEVPWLVMQHEPPFTSRIAAGAFQLGDPPLRLAVDWQPDFILCGHLHESPFRKDGSWWDKIGKTFLFNAGHIFDAPTPCFIELDTDKMTATWKTANGIEILDLKSVNRL